MRSSESLEVPFQGGDEGDIREIIRVIFGIMGSVLVEEIFQSGRSYDLVFAGSKSDRLR